METKEQHYEIVIEHSTPDNPNISIDVEKGNLKVVLNGYRLFNTMANKEAILIALNDKVGEIIQKHLDKEAESETDRKEMR